MSKIRGIIIFGVVIGTFVDMFLGMRIFTAFAIGTLIVLGSEEFLEGQDE